MARFYYDLHIHSCLSPCGDDDNTPNNILGMASLSELDIVALTDHNSCKNCPAFFAAAQRYGIVPIAGMELTTSEDIHVVCLFETLDDAMKFDEYISSRRMKVKNRPEFFGEQLILDENDEVIGKEPFVLPFATDISIDDAAALVSSFGGVCYPAHIDRDANGIIAVLGAIPKDTEFKFYELHSKEKMNELSARHSIDASRFIVSSDAHRLEDIRDKENFVTLDVDKSDAALVRRALFNFLRS